MRQCTSWLLVLGQSDVRCRWCLLVCDLYIYHNSSAFVTEEFKIFVLSNLLFFFLIDAYALKVLPLRAAL